MSDRFYIEHPPIPRDCVRDRSVDPERGGGGAVVKIGHGEAWIDGAESEYERIIDILCEAGMTDAADLIERRSRPA